MFHSRVKIITKFLSMWALTLALEKQFYLWRLDKCRRRHILYSFKSQGLQKIIFWSLMFRFLKADPISSTDIILVWMPLCEHLFWVNHLFIRFITSKIFISLTRLSTSVPKGNKHKITHFVFLPNIANCVFDIFRVDRSRVEQIRDADYRPNQNQAH